MVKMKVNTEIQFQILTALRGEEYFKSDSKDLYLGGTHIDDLINNYGISKNELSPYLPLRTKNFEKNKN